MIDRKVTLIGDSGYSRQQVEQLIEFANEGAEKEAEDFREMCLASRSWVDRARARSERSARSADFAMGVVILGAFCAFLLLMAALS